MAADAAHAPLDVRSQLAQGFGAEIGQLVGREVCPQRLHRVEFRRVGGKRLYPQPVALALQITPSETADMRGQTIPQQDHRAGNVSPQGAHSPYDPVAIDVARPQREEQPRLLGNRAVGDQANRRESLPVEGLAQDRRLASRRPGAPDAGALGKAGLVPENQGGAGFQRPFLIRGQRFLTQVWIASSSRSTARVAGFWQVQPSLRKSNQTWPRW